MTLEAVPKKKLLFLEFIDRLSQLSSLFGIKDWNGLPSDIKRDGNFNRFKTSVKRYLNSQMQLMENDIFCYHYLKVL